MTVGELRAAIEGVRDEAVLIVESRDPFLFGEKFDVTEAWAIGGNTDDPGLVLKVMRH